MAYSRPIRMGLDPSHQLTEPDIHASQLPHKIGLKWKDLARDLGFYQSTIETIEKEKGCSKECCIELVIVLWMRQKGDEATAGKLAEALERIGLKNLADNLTQGLTCCRCNCTSQRMSVDAKEANEPHQLQINKCDEMICEMSDKLRASLEEPINKFDKVICEMSDELRASVREEVSRMDTEIKELKLELTNERQRRHDTELENSTMRIGIKELEKELSIAEQKNSTMSIRIKELEQELVKQKEYVISSSADAAAREHRMDDQLKHISKQLFKYVTSLLQVTEVNQDQLTTPIKLDLLKKLSVSLQELYTETQSMIAETCKCSEDLKKEFYDFAYRGLRAQHFDLTHRVKGLESAEEEMSEEEKKAFKMLQGFQVNRQRQVDILDKLWKSLFKPLERLPNSSASETQEADKTSDGKKVMRHTDPSARTKKPNSSEEVTAPITSDDGKSDEVCFNLTGQKSKLESLKTLLRRKESDENQCSCVSYTPRRDS